MKTIMEALVDEFGGTEPIAKRVKQILDDDNVDSKAKAELLASVLGTIGMSSLSMRGTMQQQIAHASYKCVPV